MESFFLANKKLLSLVLCCYFKRKTWMMMMMILLHHNLRWASYSLQFGIKILGINIISRNTIFQS